jgi:hypothetical protein
MVVLKGSKLKASASWLGVWLMSWRDELSLRWKGVV